MYTRYLLISALVVTVALCGCVTSQYKEIDPTTGAVTKITHFAFAPPGSKNIADQQTRAAVESDGSYEVTSGSTTDMQNTFDETMTTFLGNIVMEALATGNVPAFLRPPTSEPEPTPPLVPVE